MLANLPQKKFPLKRGIETITYSYLDETAISMVSQNLKLLIMLFIIILSELLRQQVPS